MTPVDVFSVERLGYVAILWMDNPKSAFGAPFWDGLPAQMNALSDDEQVRVVIIASRSPHFSVGLDIKTPQPPLAGASEAARRRALLARVKHHQATINSVADCPKPVIAAVHGYCLGAGIDLVTACDIRLAAADAVFSIRETRIAAVADVGTLQRLPGIISHGHVAELAFTGRDISADVALHIGLVNRLVTDREVLTAQALDVAHEIAANSPLAVQGVKAVLRANTGRSVAEGLDFVAIWAAAFLGSDDNLEARRALLERRPPRFSGA
ncbi:MAG: enoyl-CoA hydratase-related protein [Rhodococcus fascians]